MAHVVIFVTLFLSSAVSGERVTSRGTLEVDHGSISDQHSRLHDHTPGTMQLFGDMVSALIPTAQDFYFFVFFCLGFSVFRLDWIQAVLVRVLSKAGKLADDEPVSLCTAAKLRENFNRGRFEAVLDGWPVLEEYTAEALKMVIAALMKLGRSADLGLFVTKTVANLPELRTSLSEIVTVISSLDGQLPRDDVTVALRDLFDQMCTDLDRRALEAFVDAFARCNDEKRVRQSMSFLAKTGAALTPAAHAMIVEAFLENRNLDLALSFAQSMALQEIPMPWSVKQKLVKSCTSADDAFSAEDTGIPRAWSAFDALQNTEIPQEALVLLLEWAARQTPVDMTMVERVEARLKASMPTAALDALVRTNAGPAGDSTKACNYFDELVRRTSPDRSLSEGALIGMIVACETSRNTSVVEHIFGWAREHGKCSLPVWSAATKILATDEQYAQICTLYEAGAAEGLVLDEAAYTELIKYAVQAGRSGLAQKLLHKAKVPDMLNSMNLIRACRHERDVPRALELLSELREHGIVDTAAYNSVLDVCVTCGASEAAHLLWDEMKQSSHVDVISYNTLLKLYVEGNSWSKVESLLEEMRLCGVQPEVWIYNALLGSVLANGDIEKAWRIVDGMEASGQSVDEHTCITLFKGFRRGRLTRDAYSVDRTLKLITKYKVKIDEALVNATLDACVRLKDAHNLSVALSTFEASGWKMPSQCHVQHTYNTLIKAYGQSRQLSTVWKMWRQVFEKGFQPSDQLYRTMIDVLVFNGRMEEALTLFDEMKKQCSSSDGRFSSQHFSSAYASLIRGFSQRKECLRAMSCYEEMQANDVKVSLVIFNTLIDACSRVSDMDRAASLFSDMLAASCTPDLITYSTLIKGYCLSGDMEKGMQLFVLMRTKGFQPDAVVFNSVLDGCAKRHMRVLCEQVIQDMAEAGVSPSNHSVSILVKLYGRCRDLEAAFRVVEEMPRDHGFKANAAVYTCLMSACIANNALDKAMDVRKRMIKEGVSLDQKTYSTLLKGALRESNIETASELISAALSQGAGLLEEELVQKTLLLISRRGLSEQVGQPLLRRLREHGMQIRGLEERRHNANFNSLGVPSKRTMGSENRLHNRRAMCSENRFRDSGINTHERWS